MSVLELPKENKQPVQPPRSTTDLCSCWNAEVEARQKKIMTTIKTSTAGSKLMMSHSANEYELKGRAQRSRHFSLKKKKTLLLCEAANAPRGTGES